MPESRCSSTPFAVISALTLRRLLIWVFFSLPRMMYSALCMRSCLNRLPSTDIDSPIRPSFVHLSLSYFNIVLPSFPLSPWTCASETFFLRARQTKAQILRETKSPLLVGKALAEMQDRRQRAVAWARKDNEVEERRKHELERSTSEEMKPGSNVRSTGTTPPTTIISHKAPPAITDVPLLGLSILGNLDAFYNHESFGPISLESLTNGCRQRAGASLLFGTYSPCLSSAIRSKQKKEDACS
jgi:hypothetical protein